MQEFINLFDENGKVVINGVAAELFSIISLPKGEENENEEKIKELVKFNNDRDDKYKFSYFLKDKNGDSLLHHAANNDYLDVLNILIERIKDEISSEIKENISKNEGKKKKVMGAQESTGEVEMKIYKEMRKILLKKINAKNQHEETPLMLACQKGYVEIVRILISNGSEFFIRDKNEDELLLSMLKIVESNNPNTIEVIKILLEFNAGLGFIALSKILHEKKLQFEPGKFGAVNVIGSGVTREHSGFELAICNLKEFLESIQEDFEKNMDKKNEQFKIYYELCKKRIENWGFENQGEKDVLIEFFQRLDFLLPSSLVRLCTRVIAGKLNGKNEEEIEKSLENLSDSDCKKMIISEMVPYGNSTKANDLSLLLGILKDFLEVLNGDTQLDEAKEEYLNCGRVRNVSLKTSLHLFSVTLFTYSLYRMIILIISNQGSTSEVALVALGFVSGMFLEIMACSDICSNSSPVELKYYEDLEEFALSTSKLDEKTQEDRIEIQGMLDILRSNKIISDELVEAFSNAAYLDELKEATQAIMSECKQLLLLHSQKSSVFYTKGSHSFFFKNEIKAIEDKDIKNSKDVVIELDGTGSKHLLDSDVDSNEGLFSQYSSKRFGYGSINGNNEI